MSLLRNNATRVLLALASVASVVFGPPIVSGVCIFLMALLFGGWEAIAIGMCADFIFLPSGSFLFPLPFFTVTALILVWAFEPLRGEFLLGG